ncbi:hypothetical protein BC629DRAFT_1467463 [Irpex lacteus]|nr:hypothetical protein BC629DRAFT_1467463 [Irpex lacteus]
MRPSSSCHEHAKLLCRICLFVAIFVCTVSGNTEIVNIAAAEADDVSFPQSSSWPTFHPNSAEYLWKIKPAVLGTPFHNVCASRQGPCEHEAWAVLDLDSRGWQSFRKFTIRISWPAYYPTEFLIETFPPKDALAAFQQVYPETARSQPPRKTPRKTRRQYVRVRLVDAGVRVSSKINSTTEATPFMIILEPLYFTVLPASVIPTLLFLLPVVLVTSVFVVPRIHRFLRTIADGIRSESTVAARAQKKQ